MRYSCENSTDGELRHARFQHVEKRETEKQKRDADISLLKVSNIENQPQQGNYLRFILTILNDNSILNYFALYVYTDFL
jgi:hypothetical protein